MQTFADVLALWPSLSELATDLGVPYGVAKQWRMRNSIPAEYWQALTAAARDRGIEGITADVLADIAARRAGRPKSEAAA